MSQYPAENSRRIRWVFSHDGSFPLSRHRTLTPSKKLRDPPFSIGSWPPPDGNFLPPPFTPNPIRLDLPHPFPLSFFETPTGDCTPWSGNGFTLHNLSEIATIVRKHSHLPIFSPILFGWPLCYLHAFPRSSSFRFYRFFQLTLLSILKSASFPPPHSYTRINNSDASLSY